MLLICLVCIFQGAFSGWTVMLNIDHSRESGFRRLLQSGGAKVGSEVLTQTSRQLQNFSPPPHSLAHVCCRFFPSGSPGSAQSFSVPVQRSHSPVRWLQSTETHRLQSERVWGLLPRSHVFEARVHRWLPHAGQRSSRKISKKKSLNVHCFYTNTALLWSPLLQEPIPPLDLYLLTSAPPEETPDTPSRKRKAAEDTSRLKKSRLNWSGNLNKK